LWRSAKSKRPDSRHRETHVLAFRAEGQLVAVSAFYYRVVEIPAVQPVEHDAWHLDVLAVRFDKQGQHLSQEALQQSLGAIQELDGSRVFVTAYVHQENAAALAVAAHFGLLPYVQHDPLYWTLLGELPPQQ
jgi:hypothetical protein